MENKKINILLIFSLLFLYVSCSITGGDKSGSGGGTSGNYFGKLIYSTAKQFSGIGSPIKDFSDPMSRSQSLKIDGSSHEK